jgi:hypothetical protein
MIKFEARLNQYPDEPYCAPTILVTDDEIGDSCPIILPENCPIDLAEKVLPKLVAELESTVTSVSELRKKLYGE